MPIVGTLILPHPPILIPSIGKGEEHHAAATENAYLKAAELVQSLAPDTIVICSPHAESYSDYFQIADGQVGIGSFAKFGAKDYNFRVLYDTELVSAIEGLALEEGFPAGSEGGEAPDLDHGTMVPLYFINKKFRSYRIVRIASSGLSLFDHYRMGKIIAKASASLDRKVLFVASGDMSHCQKINGPYGYRDEGPAYDEQLLNVLEKADFLSLFTFDTTLLSEAKECGHRSFVMMAGFLDGLAVEPKLLSHEAPFGVGYGVMSFIPKGNDPKRLFGDIFLSQEKEKCQKKLSQADDVVKLAHNSLLTYLTTGKVLKVPSDIDTSLKDNKAGVFVSIHHFGSLRGCIGTIEPTKQSVAMEIIANAIEAGTEDPRFPSIKLEEMPYLEFSVDVLSPIEHILSSKELDPHKYGVVVSSGSQKGLLLPNLEGVESVEQQIDIARRKAGISPDAFLSLDRFSVKRHS